MEQCFCLREGVMVWEWKVGECAVGVGVRLVESVGVRLDGHVPLKDDVLEKEVVFEQCVTRTLSPALTLEEGLEKLKEALQILNSPSPSSPTVLRPSLCFAPNPTPPRSFLSFMFPRTTPTLNHSMSIWMIM
ncbi:hypothetical protein JHK86_017166 [Glycine max]|nr:hypothetical protein JHK86_017166 [Glycine max]